MRRYLLAAGLCVALAVAALGWRDWSGHAATRPAGAQARAAAPVTVATVERKATPVEITAIGSVQPIATVAIRSRVDSQIDTVQFKEGDAVKAGDVLFTLDRRQIEAQLRQAQAQLARDQAQVTSAKRDVERYDTLAQREFVSRQQADQAHATAGSLDATINADQAAIDNLKVQLDFYTIRAPIAGRTGAVALKTGNLVHSGDSGAPLVTINQIDPINVTFSIPGPSLEELRAAQRAGPVAVDVAIPGGDRKIRGELSFIDNAIDAGSGAIAVKAVMPNTDEALWPGQFVNVTVTLRVDPDALTAPAQSVQIGQNGSYVYVIKSDHTAEYRPVTLAWTHGDRAVIATGVAEGEQVIVDGQLRVTDGSRVDARPYDASRSSPLVAATAR